MIQTTGIVARATAVMAALLPAGLLLAGIETPAFGAAPDDEFASQFMYISRDHPLDAATGELPHVEPHIAADPSDPDRLLAGAIVVSAESGGPWHCAAFFSANGGRSWNRHDFVMHRCIDPWALITANGEFILAAIDFSLDRPEREQFRLRIFRSGDDGHTWNSDEDLGGQHDHELLIEDPGGDLILVSRRALQTRKGFPRHVIGLMREPRGAGRFEPVATVRPSNLAQTATGLVRLLNGSLVVSYVDFQRNVDDFDRLGMLRQPRAWVMRSEDGGARFSEPLFASEGCGATDGFAGYPALAADLTKGPYGNRLYHLCVGADFDGLALTISDTGGETWSAPQRIDGVSPGELGHVRTPMLAVNRDGVVAAAWYDRRQDPERLCQDTYLTYSTDGGGTFSPALRISSQTSCPNAPGNGRVSQSWPMGGDYGSLAAAADGVFHLLWADSRGGHFQLRHAAFRVEGSGGR